MSNLGVAVEQNLSGAFNYFNNCGFPIWQAFFLSVRLWPKVAFRIDMLGYFTCCHTQLWGCFIQFLMEGNGWTVCNLRASNFDRVI